MKKMFLAAAIGLIGLSACGDDGDRVTNDSDRVQIQACIASGGTPSFSMDSYGNVTEYFGCISAVAP